MKLELKYFKFSSLYYLKTYYKRYQFNLTIKFLFFIIIIQIKQFLLVLVFNFRIIFLSQHFK